MIRQATGIVLAGGSSHRFGSNKALLLWNGKRLIEKIVTILVPLFPHTMIMVKEPDKFQFLRSPGVSVVRDLFSEIHPLGGIYSGLSLMKTEYAFVCACDMPLLQPELITALYKACEGFDAAIPVWQGVPQPLCGVYSKRCLEPIQRMVEKNRFMIRKLFCAVQTRFFKEEEVKPIDPEGISFADIDTKEDYERLKEAKSFTR